MTSDDVEARPAGADAGDGARTREVTLVGFPLMLADRASAHYAEVLREMTMLVATGAAPVGSVPHRVTELVAALVELRELMSGFDSTRAEAIARGETCRDMSLTVSPQIVAMSRQLDGLLDAVDDYCRCEMVLTLAPDPVVVTYRRWYVDQLETQLAGAPPAAWSGAAG